MVAFVEEIGIEKNKVLIVDDFLIDPTQLISHASAASQFKAAPGSLYPGLQRFITSEDGELGLYVHESLQVLAPLISKVFSVPGVSILRASFCLVTKRPEELSLWQKFPHIDQADPRHFALLHFLSPTPQGGTNFFRHRSTGFERISLEREPIFAEARKKEIVAHGPPPISYFNDSDQHFERIANFEGKYNRILIYQGSLLHSGYIPQNFTFNPDPTQGRLTLNVFLQAQS